jgi:uncharacterized membrane protein YjgN (DUF898 family)
MEIPRPVDSPSVRNHKSQLAWQILVPILLVAALVIAAAVLVVKSTGSASSTWADISTIWLIAPMLVFALVFVILLGFLIYGIARLLQVTPRYTGKVQNLFFQISGRTRGISNAATQPVVWVHQAGAILKSIFRL